MSEEKKERGLMVGDGGASAPYDLLLVLAGMAILALSLYRYLQWQSYGLLFALGLLSMLAGLALAAKVKR